MTLEDVQRALIQRVGCMSVLKVCLVVAQQTGCGRHKVRLTLADLAELAAMAHQTVCDGVAGALSAGLIEREPSGNTYWYGLKVAALEPAKSSLKRYEIQTETVRDSDSRPPEIQTDSTRNPDSSGTPYTSPEELEREGELELRQLEDSAEARSLAVMQGQPNPAHVEIEARHFFVGLIGRDNAEHPQIKPNRRRWYRQFGADAIARLWSEAFEQTRKDPLWFFVDSLNGRPTGARSLLKRPQAKPKPPERPLATGQPVRWRGRTYPVLDASDQHWVWLEGLEHSVARAELEVPQLSGGAPGATA